MSSTIVIDASTVPEPTPPATQHHHARRQLTGSGQTFGGVLRSERIKFTSLLSVRLTLLITVVVGLGMSTLIAALFSQELGGDGGMLAPGVEGLQSYLLFAATQTSPFLALVFGVLGVFAISSEYSSGMILSTLTAVPKRGPVFAAKGLLLAAVSGVTAAALVLGGLAIAVAFMPEAAAELGSTTVISGALGTVAYLVLIALFAFGVSALLRSTAGGIAVVAGVTFVLPIVFQMLSMTGWDWVGVAMNYLPMPLGSFLATGITETPSSPDFWTALLSMGVWAAVPLVPAAILFKRRDAH